jgi:hypothetical protein
LNRFVITSHPTSFLTVGSLVVQVRSKGVNLQVIDWVIKVRIRDTSLRWHVVLKAGFECLLENT